jgi:uncharacterized protein YndB with AHSA1/START domain
MSAPIKKGHVLVLKRVFDAPPARVFKAWTDPKQFAAWWGPHGFTAPLCQLDVRPGGAILVHMKGPDGSPFSEPMPMGGTFLEVVPPTRLVFTATAFPDGKGGWKLENRNEVTFTAKGNRTELVLRVTVLKDSPEIAPALAGMEQGWSQSLEKLAELRV